VKCRSYAFVTTGTGRWIVNGAITSELALPLTGTGRWIVNGAITSELALPLSGTGRREMT